jgi:hypothetical protein
MMTKPRRRVGALYALTGSAMTAMLAALCLIMVGQAKADPPIPPLPPAPSSLGSSPLLPAQDSFYNYAGRLAPVARGTVLRRRTVTVSWLGLSTPVTATQLLYRTTNQMGTPTVTVTTVLQAARPQARLPVRILSYQFFYDGLGSACDPSYNVRDASLENVSQVQQGNVMSGNDTQAEEGFITPYLAAGDTVVMSDYEGENLAWGAGQQSGYQTLDGIQAAENFLHVKSRHTPVALLGYSGGSIATVWAQEVAPAYAPGLDIVGAAAGGVPVDFAHELPYLNGSPSWAGAMPGVLVGVARAFNVDLMSYMSAYGQKLAQTVSDQCANSFESAYPGLTIQQLVQPQYQDLLAQPVIASVINELIVGSDGTPKAPVFLAVGNSDGTGDGVIAASDVEGLAHLYCQRGVSVQFDEYQNLDHLESGGPFESKAYAFIHAWLAGLPTPNGCSSVGSGSSLAPLPAGTSPPAPPASAISSANVTSVDPAASATALDGSDSLTVAGAGAATLSQFAPGHDPVGPTTFDSTGRFLDVAIAPGSQLTGATLLICGVGAGRLLEWWNPAAGSGAGAWQPLSPAARTTVNPVDHGPSPCLTASLSDSSSPSMGRLGSVVLGLGRPSRQPGR